MAVIKRILFLLAVVSLSGCGLALQRGEDAASGDQNLEGGPIQGQFRALDGSTVDLASESEKIQVLMFVSETCLTCRHETEGLVADRQQRGIPTNAAFYSVVIGAFPEDAADWSSSLGVNWVVGTNAGDNLFRTYCRAGKTPCVVLHNPVTNQNQKIEGARSIADWESFTGAWSF